jgi:4-amino-4-deoxy-L-arabinose transferase-like glycosyltransferase
LEKRKRHLKIDWWLVVILLMAAWFYGWNIWKAGSANDYYTAAIVSMTQSWHNFWYAAFDPAGFITVDKPPVALWIMAIFAKIFGVHGWSIVLPSVLAGLGSVGLLYHMIKPKFGPWAARLAALFMTLTPIVVADSRTNNMDAILIFFLLLAADFLFTAIEKKRAWLVLLSFGLIGVSFNIKMLQAFMILPAMYFVYWISSRQSIKKRVLTLIGATAALIALTLAWPVAVDSTSASSRPYVGSSQKNSELELAFGYNGTERLLGQSTGTGGAFPGMNKNSQEMPNGGAGGNGGAPGGQTAQNDGQAAQGTPPNGADGGTQQGGTPPTQQNGQQDGNTQNAQQAAPGGAEGMMGQGKTGAKGKGGPDGTGGGGGAFAIGSAGPLRLLQSDLGPLISWLLPLALIGFISAYAYYRDPKKKWYQTTIQQGHLWFWIGWLVPVYGFFAVASFFHPYYMIMLAPPIAALAAIGLTTLAKQFFKKGWRASTFLLPAALAVTIALEAWYVSLYYSWQPWALAALGTLSLIGLFIAKQTKFIKPAMGLTLAAILVAPAWWSATPTLAAESSAIPTAGPSLLEQSQGGGMGGGIGNGSVDSELLSYVLKHQESATYLFATSDAGTAAPYIIKSGKAVMATGGFNGTDPAITLKEFKALVKEGKVKYYYLSGRSSNSTIAKWVEKNGKKITLSSSKSSTSSTGNASSAQATANQPNTGQQNSTAGNVPDGAGTPGGTGAAQGEMQGGGMGGSGTLYELSAD